MLRTPLPVPPFFDPQSVDAVWRVPYQQRANDAAEWRLEHCIPASADDSFRVSLMLVDVQNTFCIPEFELYVGGRSGRGAVDDNYSYEVWALGSKYPWQEESPALPTIELRGEDLFLNQKKIRFHRSFRTMRKRLVIVPIKKKRLQEHQPGEWKRQWEGHMICSYPPEDIVVEGWGHYIKKKAGQILAAEERWLLEVRLFRFYYQIVKQASRQIPISTLPYEDMPPIPGI